MSDRSAPHRQIRQPGNRSPIGWSISDDELLAVATAMHVVRHPAGTVLVPARHNRRPGRRVPGYLLPRPGRSARRRGLLVLALRYLGLIGGLVGCAVILGTPPVLATAAGLLGALLGTVVAR